MDKKYIKETTNNSNSVKNFEELLTTIHLLKDKKHGCPWQKSQTHKKLIPYLLEECYELIDAINNEDRLNTIEELGDILFQVMLHSEIGYENNEFSIEDIILFLNNKIKARTPYVFDEKRRISIDEAEKIWKTIKQKEKKNTVKGKISNNLYSRIKNLSPIEGVLTISLEIQKYGFKWKNKEEILTKLDEETKELQEGIQISNMNNIEEEIGDLFFTLINLSNYLNISPQKAISNANQKFLRRFSIIEDIVGDKISKQSKAEFKKLWQEAKGKESLELYDE
tara:strand:+ start:917 stop:1759 length:843 start_codon:yes stop_codon:yes gene_type:complete